MWLFLMVLLVGLQCEIVVFPGHTHFLWMDTGLDRNNTHRYVDVTNCLLVMAIKSAVPVVHVFTVHLLLDRSV